MAAAKRSDDRDVTDQDEQSPAFEDSLLRYLKRADERPPLPSGFLERLQRDTPTYRPREKPAHIASTDELVGDVAAALAEAEAQEEAAAQEHAFVEAPSTLMASASLPQGADMTASLQPPTAAADLGGAGPPPHLRPAEAASPHEQSSQEGGMWQGSRLEGQVLASRYRIEERVAKGGMSWIYRGHHLHLKTPVAVKVLFPELVEEEAFRKRFFDEARALSHLDHPHIVRVFDVFEERGLIGMALEWVEGKDLFSWFSQRKQPLSLQEVHEIAAPIFDAIETIHDHGMIHRDLKPDNVLLDLRGDRPHPKIADFGLVRAEQARSGARTHTGARLGTPLYMSPEQIKDSKLADHRADLYSLGAIIYELLLGRPPFVGDEQWLLVQQLHALPTAPDALWPGIPSQLSGILMKSLAKDPDERYPSCTAFGEALLSCLQEHGELLPHWSDEPPAEPVWDAAMMPQRQRSPAATTQAKGRGRLGWAVLIGVAVLGLLAGALALWLAGSFASPQGHGADTTTPAIVPKAGIERGVPPPARPHRQTPPAPTLNVTPRNAPVRSSAPTPRHHPNHAARPSTSRSKRRAHRRSARSRRARKARPAGHRRGIAPTARRSRASVVTLHLSTSPSGARVWIGGRPLPGKTPLTFKATHGQKIQLKLIRPGYKTHIIRWRADLRTTQKTVTLRVDDASSQGRSGAPADRPTMRTLHDVW